MAEKWIAWRYKDNEETLFTVPADEHPPDVASRLGLRWDTLERASPRGEARLSGWREVTFDV